MNSKPVTTYEIWGAQQPPGVVGEKLKLVDKQVPLEDLNPFLYVSEQPSEHRHRVQGSVEQRQRDSITQEGWPVRSGGQLCLDQPGSRRYVPGRPDDLGRRRYL